MIIDTHSHCYWDTLEPRIDELLSNMKGAGVERAVQIGCDRESSEKAISLANRYPDRFSATVGLHPESAQDIKNTDSIIQEFEALIQEHRMYIVAIGETGLDFHYLDGLTADEQRNPIRQMDSLSLVALEQIEHQKYFWKKQWELAKRYDLPLVIHTRDAREATLDFMLSEGVDRAVMHCFSEDYDFARVLLEFSQEIYFSFSGIVTYKSAQKIQEAARLLPLDRILVETDSPFLAPQPVRGQVCEPAFIRYTLEKIAELRGVSVSDIEDTIYDNSLRFYRISNR